MSHQTAGQVWSGRPPHHGACRQGSPRCGYGKGARSRSTTPPPCLRRSGLAESRRKTTVGFLAPCRRLVLFEQGSPAADPPQTKRPLLPPGDWRKACRALDLKPIRTKPYNAADHGKAETFIKPSWRNGLRDRYQNIVNVTAGLYPAIWDLYGSRCQHGLSVASTPPAMPPAAADRLNDLVKSTLRPTPQDRRRHA